jgi:isoleucyl-tRNA synthetase
MNYKDTVFLPRTDFPMRAGLPKKEPEILQSWQQVDLYRKLRETRQGAQNLSFMTARPMPMDSFILAMR